MNLKRILEALLFVADTPLGLPRLASLLETSDRAAVRQALLELMAEYQERDCSFEVVEVAGGYSFRTKPEYGQWLQKLGKQQTSRLSQAALETLAAIAYKQPVLRAEIERIRGVDVGGVLRMLMEKGLVQVVGRQDLPGRPLIYGTTKRFLEVFGLNSIKDLPTMEEMESLMGEMAAAREAGEEDSDLLPLGQSQGGGDEQGPEGEPKAGDHGSGPGGEEYPGRPEEEPPIPEPDLEAQAQPEGGVRLDDAPEAEEAPPAPEPEVGLAVEFDAEPEQARELEPPGHDTEEPRPAAEEAPDGEEPEEKPAVPRGRVSVSLVVEPEAPAEEPEGGAGPREGQNQGPDQTGRDELKD